MLSVGPYYKLLHRRILQKANGVGNAMYMLTCRAETGDKRLLDCILFLTAHGMKSTIKNEKKIFITLEKMELKYSS